MIEALKYILLGGMVLLSLAAVQGARLRRSVIYLGGFSLLSSLLYILYLAPDVAIAEAIIGCTISVILLLVAIKKYRDITIYYVAPDNENNESSGEAPAGAVCVCMLEELELYLTGFEFEPHLLSTTLDDSELNDKQDFDLLIVRQGSKVCMYSPKESYHTPLIREFLKNKRTDGLIIEFVPMGGEAEYED